MEILNNDDLVSDSNKRNEAIVGLKEAIEYGKALDKYIKSYRTKARNYRH